MTRLHAIVGAGTLGGLALVPFGLVIRHGFGGPVNVYGELVVERLFGRVVPWAVAVEHLVASWMFAAPLAWWGMATACCLSLGRATVEPYGGQMTLCREGTHG